MYAIRSYYEQKDGRFNKLFARIEKQEAFCDNIEVEIANYLTQVSQGKLSDVGKKKIRAMLKLIDDLESIGDHNYNLARNIQRMRNNFV